MSNERNDEHDDVHSETDEFEREYNEIKSQKERFDISLENKINTIPDYQENVRVRRGKSSTFAKIMGAFIIIGISILLAILIISSAQEIFGINRQDKVTLVDIPENSGVSGIAEILEDRKIIRSAFLFKAYYKLFGEGTSLNYGLYELNSNMSYDVIFENMAEYAAAKDEVTVTFPEGMTIYEVANKLESSKVCDATEFIEVLNSKAFGVELEKSLTINPLKFHKFEGFIFPDTYNFYIDDTPINVAKKMLREFDKKITPEMRAKMQEMGYTLEQTITIASIVQKEAGKTEEMRRVSSVYHNRLNNKDIYPNLQACPTRDYANQLKTQMKIIDQSIIDAYNTYEDAGLPPGPICNPGVDAIKATLDPETTDYFFFCTSAAGDFYYGKTLKDHEKNIRKAGLG